MVLVRVLCAPSSLFQNENGRADAVFGFFSSLATATLEVQSLLQKMTMQNPLSLCRHQGFGGIARSSW